MRSISETVGTGDIPLVLNKDFVLDVKMRLFGLRMTYWLVPADPEKNTCCLGFCSPCEHVGVPISWLP